MDEEKKYEEQKRQSAFSRAFHSIRTRYSLATAIFLMIILAAFYIGGRIVLVHFVRDAEQQVQGISLNIGRVVNRDADRLCRLAVYVARKFDEAHETGETYSAARLLEEGFGIDLALAVRLDEKGRFAEGAVTSLARATAIRLGKGDLDEYLRNFTEWSAEAKGTNDVRAVGLLKINGRAYYGARARCQTGGIVLIGTPFDMKVFTARMTETLSGMEVHVRRGQPPSNEMPVSLRPLSKPVDHKTAFGLAPMVSEAINFYSGGFWEFGTHPLEAAFTIRDIAGRPVSAIVVSLPRSFSSATSVALGRLTFFITMIGIVLILPVFWFQSQLLLNPLTTMIERIRQVGERHDVTDCPRIEWSGKDEFAQLAVSVNRMLETLSRRSLAVAQSESRQKAMLSSLPDGLVIFDRNHRAVAIVKQPDDLPPIPGLAEGEPLDIATYGAEGSRALGEALVEVAAGGSRKHLQLTAAEGTPARRVYELRLSRMDDFFILGSIRDITAETAEHERLHNAESRLARMHKQESMAQLAAGIAHDVNNVLAVVLNTLEITWLDNAEDDPIVSSALATIKDAVRRGTDMMRELMTFAGETTITLKRSNPAELVNASSRLIAGTLGPRVSVHYDLPSNLPTIDADATQFWKIFFNLARNAAEAMAGHAGEITISAKAFEMTPALATTFMSSRALRLGPGVLFRVSDNGPGIPPAIARRIFDPYVSTKSAGRGLGLAIVASIVAAHEGGISVHSSPVDGTTFGIFVPVSKISEEPTSAPTEMPSAPAEGAVLVVDDDQGILKTTSILLSALKLEPHTASDPDSALAEFRRFAARLVCVILDAHLGHFDVVRLLRAFRMADAHVPVVVSSGATAEETAQLFKAQPYNGFLAKPFTLAELRAALARCGRIVPTAAVSAEANG